MEQVQVREPHQVTRSSNETVHDDDDEEMRHHYSGQFDPDVFATDFIEKVARAHRSVRDVSFLNTLYLSRGGDIGKITSCQSLTSDALNLIEHLRHIYGIKSSSSNAEDVTLDRLHLAFPVVGCRVAALVASTRGVKSYGDRFMAMLGCRAFARYCPTLVAFGGGEGLLYMDAHRWACYSIAMDSVMPDKQSVIRRVEKETTAWAVEDLDLVSDALENKLALFQSIDYIIEKDVEYGVDRALALETLHKLVTEEHLRTTELEKIVAEAMETRSTDLRIDANADFEIDNTPLTVPTVLDYSGALVNYLTLLKDRLLNESDCDENDSDSFLMEAASVLADSRPEDIIECMAMVGLKTTWECLVGRAYVKILEKQATYENMPMNGQRDLIRYGLSKIYKLSALFDGCYPTTMITWASNWREVSCAFSG